MVTTNPPPDETLQKTESRLHLRQNRPNRSVCPIVNSNISAQGITRKLSTRSRLLAGVSSPYFLALKHLHPFLEFGCYEILRLATLAVH